MVLDKLKTAGTHPHLSLHVWSRSEEHSEQRLACQSCSLFMRRLLVGCIRNALSLHARAAFILSTPRTVSLWSYVRAYATPATPEQGFAPCLCGKACQLQLKLQGLPFSWQGCSAQCCCWYRSGVAAAAACLPASLPACLPARLWLCKHARCQRFTLGLCACGAFRSTPAPHTPNQTTHASVHCGAGQQLPS